MTDSTLEPTQLTRLHDSANAAAGDPTAQNASSTTDYDNDRDDIQIVDPMEPAVRHRSQSARAAARAAIATDLQRRFDETVLHQTLADAGRWAYGVVLAEVWVMDATSTALIRPEAGWWIDPVYHDKESGTGCNSVGSEGTCEICRLVNSTRPDYLTPGPLAPGQGLPGLLWSEVGYGDDHVPATRSAHAVSSPGRFHTMRQRVISIKDFVGHSLPSPAQRVVWRDVPALAADPDQPWHPRLQHLARIGLGWAAAVPFDHGSKQGIVMYCARRNVQHVKLQSAANELYLVAASALVGAAYALRAPRSVVVHERHVESADAFDRVRRKILTARHMGITLSELVAQNEAAGAGAYEETVSEHSLGGSSHSSKSSVSQAWLCFIWKLMRRKIVLTLRKFRGGRVTPPPPFGWRSTTWTFVGSFVTLMAVTRLHIHVVQRHGPAYGLTLTPFGALTTLLYGLTAAPASQPRNALGGQAVALVIALAISSIDSMPEWMKQTLATSLAIATMVKLGVTHPPAGAAALIFATGEFSWGNYLFMLVGTLIAVIISTCMNNLSNKRQYPTFWGLPGVLAERRKA